MNITSTSRFCILFALHLGLITHINAQVATTLFDKWYGDEFMELTIESDLSAIDSLKDGSLSARFTYKTAEGEEDLLYGKIKLRGRFRRRVCDFPPLKLKVKKKELQERGLDEHNDFKLVTHCMEDDRLAAQDAVMREYLAYRMYALLTPIAYRVQLVRVTYKDESNTFKDRRRWGILIEDTDALAERLASTECENCFNRTITAIQPENFALVSLYQYMIGNADYDFGVMRNVKLFTSFKELDRYVPYDFDFSGFVATSYAIPNSQLGQKRITDRLIVGAGHNLESMGEAYKLLHRKKDDMLNLIRNMKRLSVNSRTVCQDYIEEFFEQVETLQHIHDDNWSLYLNHPIFDVDGKPEVIIPGGR